MKPSILFVVTGDPRISARPAEAIRIAAGIGSWQRTDVYLYLHGAAIYVLSSHADDWPDGDNYARYLPLIAAFERPVYVESAATLPPDVEETFVPIQKLSGPELAAHVGQMTYVTRF